jgi:hypothetical protein
MTATLPPGARIWRGGVPTMVPGFDTGGTVDDTILPGSHDRWPVNNDPKVNPWHGENRDVRVGGGFQRTPLGVMHSEPGEKIIEPWDKPLPAFDTGGTAGKKPKPKKPSERTLFVDGNRVTIKKSRGNSWKARLDDGNVVGDIYLEKSGGRYFVSDLSVAKAYQRSGIGTALWEAAGKPLHDPANQTPAGSAWAEAVGGESLGEAGDDDYGGGTSYKPKEFDWGDEDFDDPSWEDDPVKPSVAPPSAESENLVLYHGTTREYLDRIRGEGLKPPSSVNPRNWLMLTTSREQAESYINERPNGVVLEYNIPKDRVWSRGRKDALLWPSEGHNVYEQEADAYGLRQPVPNEYLKSVHEVGEIDSGAGGLDKLSLDKLTVAKPSDLRMINAATEANWQSAINFDPDKEQMRSAAREAQLGYKGLQLTPREIEDLDVGLPPKDLTSIMGREIVARAVHSDPTEKMLYRGVMYDEAAMSELVSGEVIPLPLSSFTENRSEAKRFASGEAWRSTDIPDDAKGVVFQLESGAKVAEVSGEQVGFGRFKVVSNRWNGRGPRVVTLRQVSMIESTPEELIRTAFDAIHKKGGITIDLTGNQPTEGYGYAPSKETELRFDPGKITPEDVEKYIDDHYDELTREGHHFGAWVSDEDKAVYLDVSKVGPASPETLTAAQEAEQLGIWDFAAPPELGELRIGRMDEDERYHRLGEAADLHAQHQREIEAAIERRSSASTSEVPRVPEKPAAPAPVVKPPEPGARIWRDGKPFRVSKDGPGRGGPGAAKMKPPLTAADVLGTAGRVAGAAGKAAGVLGTAATIYEGVEDIADPNKRRDLLHPSDAIKQATAELQDQSDRIVYGPQYKDLAVKRAAGMAYLKVHGKMPDGFAQWVAGTGPMPTDLAPPTGVNWNAGRSDGFQSGGQLQLHNTFRVQHANGTVTRHELRQTGPKSYESGGRVKLRPGDQILLDGEH